MPAFTGLKRFKTLQLIAGMPGGRHSLCLPRFRYQRLFLPLRDLGGYSSVFSGRRSAAAEKRSRFPDQTADPLHQLSPLGRGGCNIRLRFWAASGPDTLLLRRLSAPLLLQFGDTRGVAWRNRFLDKLPALRVPPPFRNGFAQRGKSECRVNLFRPGFQLSQKLRGQRLLSQSLLSRSFPASLREAIATV